MSDTFDDQGEGSEQESDLRVLTLEPHPQKSKTSFLTWVALGVLLLPFAAVLVPKFLYAQNRTVTACKSNLKNIGTALEMYSTDYSGKYPASLDQLLPNYLVVIPECPSADSVTYVANFGPKAPMNPDGYVDYYYVACVGENHLRWENVSGDYPAYNGIQGLVERSP